MSRVFQTLTILAISLVVILLTLSLSSRALIFHNSQMTFSTALADDDEHSDDEQADSDDDEHSDDEHADSDDDEHSDDEHDEHSDDDEHSDSVDNTSSYMQQTPKVQQY